MAKGIKTRRGESKGQIIIIYNNGVINTDFTGGLETFYSQSGSTVTYGSSDITIVSTSGNVTIVGSTNKIDVTAFKKLKIEVTSNNGTFQFGLSSEKGLDFFNNGISKTTVGNVSSATTFEADINSVNGLYYFAMRTGGPTTAKVTKIWLE